MKHLFQFVLFKYISLENQDFTFKELTNVCVSAFTLTTHKNTPTFAQ